MAGGPKTLSDEPSPVVIDLSDPPGGRSWLHVADAVVTLTRLSRATSRDPRCCVIVGAPPVTLGPRQLAAVEMWATALPSLPDSLDPWLGEPLVGPLLAIAGTAVASATEAHPAPGTRRVEDLYPDQERTAATAVVAVVGALLSVPVVHVEELLEPGGAGPWMRWARRRLSGRPCHPQPTTSAADRCTVDMALREELTGGDVSSTRLVHARSEDPATAALTAAQIELTRPAAATSGSCPIVPVVVPPRPHRLAQVIERQQRAAWDGTVKWGNTWTLELTRRLQDHLKLTHDYQVLTTVSGTAALRMAYEQVAPAAGREDVAVLPSFTFAATGESLRQLGYRLRFVDVDPVTWTMDPDRLREALADGRPRLVVVVDTFGAPAAHEVIADIAHEHGVPVVADSAPSLGSLYRGRPLGMQQAAHAFSLSFAKTVTAGGAGGALVVPADASVAEGRNWWRSSSMAEMHAVFALDQLDRVEELVARRQSVAAEYDEVIGAHGIRRQQEATGDRHSWVHYVIQLPSLAARERVARALADLGVQTKPYYAPVLHDPVWKDAFAADASAEPANLPVTHALAATTLALPMSSELRACEVEQVAVALDLVLGLEAW